MYQDLKKVNKKMVVLICILCLIAAAILTIIYFDLFGVLDYLEAEEISRKNSRLFGGGFAVFILITSPFNLWRTLTQTPLKSIEKYARTTTNPETVMEQLQQTWENGLTFGNSRIDEQYLITIFNSVHAFVFPLKDVVWAYKRVTKMNLIFKIDTRLCIHFANGKSKDYTLKEKNIELILQHLMENHRDIVIGSNNDIEKIYYRQKDMTAFKEYAWQQRLGIN